MKRTLASMLFLRLSLLLSSPTLLLCLARLASAFLGNFMLGEMLFLSSP